MRRHAMPMGLGLLACMLTACATPEFELSVRPGPTKDQVVVNVKPLDAPPGDDKSWRIDVYPNPAGALTMLEIESSFAEVTNPNSGLPFAALGRSMEVTIPSPAPTAADTPQHSGVLLAFATQTRLLVVYRGKCDEYALERWFGQDERPTLSGSNMVIKHRNGFTRAAP